NPVRRRSADFFHRDFTDNNFLDYRESSLTALLRSLEMFPLNSSRQFELAEYYRNRGWEKKQKMAAGRAETLGFDPPTRLQDYLEGLGSPDTHQTPAIPQPTLGVTVSVGSVWDGPLDGPDQLESMFRQNFFHQPGFAVYGKSIESEDELGNLVEGDTLDGGVSISIDSWNNELSASMTLMLPSGDPVTEGFYDNDGMEEWNLLNTTLRNLKQEWPWEGSVYRVTNDGAWVNLGRIHGLQEGDTFVFKKPSEAYPDQLNVGEIHEDKLRLSFPSPYYKTVVPRGATVHIKRQ
ncbi:MAG: hypothetical protein ABEK50_04540, partial [bacterium]